MTLIVSEFEFASERRKLPAPFYTVIRNLLENSSIRFIVNQSERIVSKEEKPIVSESIGTIIQSLFSRQ